MGEINLSDSEKNALTRIDLTELGLLVEKSIDDQRLDGLYVLRLSECGPYVAKQFGEFQRALVDHGKSKAAKKWAETSERFRRAGGRLIDAVRQMKRRMEQEDEEGKFFRVEDCILYPLRFNSNLSVTISYQWRKNIDDNWSYGSITFNHTVELRPAYSPSTSKLKPSAAKQREELESRLYSDWEHLMRLALYSVRDFFRNGGDGAEIPEIFQARVDPYSQYLNNFSADFWRERR